MSYVPVSPGSRLDYQHDWSDWLAQGDSIVSREWTIVPDGSPSMLANETSAVVTVEDFAAGEVYRLTETITTAGGMVDSRMIVLRCDET